MKGKRKIFEVTTKDYGKGYVAAKSEAEALRKAQNLFPREKFRSDMTGHYDDAKKGSKRWKELNVWD